MDLGIADTRPVHRHPRTGHVPRQDHREEQAELDDSEERLRAVFPAPVRRRLKHADQSRALFAIR